MALNIFVIVTPDPAASKKTDRTDHRNTAVGGTAAGGSFTLAIDSAVVTTLTQVNSLYVSARARLAGQLPP